MSRRLGPERRGAPAAPVARTLLVALAALVAAAGTGCRRGAQASLLEDAALGGYAVAGDAESYNAATLYVYMDGGADVFLEYGVSGLAVRRYTSGATQLIVELYTMRDRAAAAALYSSTRRREGETEIQTGCRGDVEPAEARVARGDHYLVCRDENVMSRETSVVRDLCSRLVARLAGECGVGSFFDWLPSAGRVPGTEVALAGPLGLNQRAWLTPVGREGFERGWLASYDLGGGRAEVLFAEYASAEAARAAWAPLQTSPRPGTSGLARERRLVVGFGDRSSHEPLAGLVARLAEAANSGVGPP